MELIKAVTLSLGEIEEPVITEYSIGLIVFRIYKKKEYKGEKITRIQKEFAERSEFRNCFNQLLNEGVLDKYKGTSSLAYSLLGRSKFSVEDVVCTIDPFCYISHLSAMSYHGITNRIPNKLFISSPSAKQWVSFATKRMQRDLSDDYETYKENGLPRLTRTELTKINRVEISRFSSIHLGAYKNVRDRSIRVSTIGRTFLDMLRNPELCGGINHVLEVFDEFSQKYIRLITDEINNNGTKIDKVRAGYILDERLNIKNETVNEWTKFAQRGGSRKLDPASEYIPVWSDKWCLSLNIFE